MHSFSTMAGFHEHADRSKREAAARARWAAFAQRGPELDAQFDHLVALRTRMARTLGYDDFIALGYRRLARVDYGVEDVRRYRDAILRHVVPLATELAESTRARLGVDRLEIWDEGIFDRAPAPAPPPDCASLLAATREGFASMRGDLGDFCAMMIDGGLLDVAAREGKASGGFCLSFPAYGLPYVFAHSNGTTRDVNLLVHEMGHALQAWSCREKFLSDYMFPTLESAEMHSMALEFLVWPQLHRFFANDAPRYRAQHLAASIAFLPYAAAIDEFQHVVYADPALSPAERRAAWSELERRYMPWRSNGGIPYLEAGGYWQYQRHVYSAPFYYIDYALALNCALQFWVRSQRDYDGTLSDYLALCARGGEAPFQTLVRDAGLRSPFDDAVLADLVQHARAELFCPVA